MERATKDRIISQIEEAIVTVLQLLIILLITIDLGVLFILLFRKLYHEVFRLDSVESLLPAMQQSFGGVLTVVLGLELLETLKAFFTEHHVRVEVILVVAILAMGRHLLIIDLEHTSGPVLIGIAAIIASLTIGYFLARRSSTNVSHDS